MSKEKRLGRGLGTLLGEGDGATAPMAGIAKRTGDVLDGPPNEHFSHIDVDLIRPNPFQPRKEFEERGIQELADSIRESGVLQPVLLRKVEDGYELIAGERRWRACRLAGLESIPAFIKDVDDGEMLVIALVENVQREDLNAIEKARAFMDLATKLSLTHERVAEKVGINRSTVTNFLRLLELPESIQELVSRGTISMGHARALLGITKVADQLKLVEQIVREELSVRKVEALVSMTGKRKKKSPLSKDPLILELEGRLRDVFGSKVTITDHAGRGQITIEFYSTQQLNELLEKLTDSNVD